MEGPQVPASQRRVEEKTMAACLVKELMVRERDVRVRDEGRKLRFRFLSLKRKRDL